MTYEPPVGSFEGSDYWELHQLLKSLPERAERVTSVYLRSGVRFPVLDGTLGYGPHELWFETPDGDSLYVMLIEVAALTV